MDSSSLNLNWLRCFYLALLTCVAMTHTAWGQVATPTPPLTTESSASTESSSLPLTSQSSNTRPGGIIFSAAIGGTRLGRSLRQLPNASSDIYFNINVGYRWHRQPRIQLEGGFDIFEGLGVDRIDALPGEYGYEVEDINAVFYLGTRLFVTPPDKPVRFSLGLGGARGAYRETTEFSCDTCQSRGAGGWYGLAQLDFYHRNRASFGVGAKQFYLRSNGTLFSDRLGRNSSDRLTAFYLVLELRFK